LPWTASHHPRFLAARPHEYIVHALRVGIIETVEIGE